MSTLGRTLDVPEQQVLLVAISRSHDVSYEHHILLLHLGNARWAALDTRLEVTICALNLEPEVIALGRNDVFPVVGGPIHPLPLLSAAQILSSSSCLPTQSSIKSNNR